MEIHSKLSAVICIFFVSTLSLYAKIFDGLLVNNQGDTIICQLNLEVNMFNKKDVNSLSCKKRLKVVHIDGQKKTYLPHDIKSFLIFNTSDGNMTYESHTVEGESCFIQFIQKGVFEVYKYYYPHSHDGACLFYYTIRKAGGTFIKLAPIGWRARLQKTFSEDEYFTIEKLEKNYTYEQIPEFFEKYKN